MDIEKRIENTIVEYYKELYNDCGDITLGDLKMIATVNMKELAWKAFETFKHTKENHTNTDKQALYDFAKTLIGKGACCVESSLKMLFREAPKIGLKFFYGTDKDGLLETFIPSSAKIIAVGIENKK